MFKKVRSKNTFGSFIRQARDEAGKTQAGLGVRVAVDQATISRWESGQKRPEPSDIVAVVDATGKVWLLDAYCSSCPVKKRKTAR